MIFLVPYFFDILILLMPSQPGGDDGDEGGERTSKSDPAPFPSRPGMEYRVRLPLTPTIDWPEGLQESWNSLYKIPGEILILYMFLLLFQTMFQ